MMKIPIDTKSGWFFVSRETLNESPQKVEVKANGDRLTFHFFDITIEIKEASKKELKGTYIQEGESNHKPLTLSILDKGNKILSASPPDYASTTKWIFIQDKDVDVIKYL